MSNNEKKPGLGRALLSIPISIGVVVVLGVLYKAMPENQRNDFLHSTSASHRKETYRLIHAIGNDERENARGLSKSECENRKSELIGVSTALGVHSERLGIGSITCLPESVF